MDEQVSLTASSASATIVTHKPLESEQTFQKSTTSPFVHVQDTQSHSHTLGQPTTMPPKQLPPTAMVAPLVETRGHSTSSLITSPTRSPKMSKRGFDRTYYGIETALSSPSLDRGHEKLTSSIVMSPSKSDRRIQSLKNSLNERSQLIERQKLTISRLQQECREKDSQLRKLRSNELMCSGDSNSDITSSGSAISAPVKIDMLTRKLDSLYFQLDKNNEEFHVTSDKLKEQEKRSTELEKQLEQSRSHSKDLEEKLDQLQGYLGDMPTMEEHYRLKEDVSSLTTECNQLKKQIMTSNEKMIELKETVCKREDELRDKLKELAESRASNHELELTVQSLDNSLTKLQSEKTQLESKNKTLQETISKNDQRLHSELSAMRERHHLRFRDATAKLRDQHKDVVKRNKQLEKQLLKTSDTMSQLTSELNLRQGMVGELKSSVSLLVNENQGLLQQNLALQASHADVIRSTQSSPADNGVIHKLVHEMTLCVDDFESLVGLTSSIIKGHDPSSSLLLGVSRGDIGGSTAATITTGDETDTQKQLDKVMKLREEIDRLRSTVTERYTDQIANDCNVQ